MVSQVKRSSERTESCRLSFELKGFVSMLSRVGLTGRSRRVFFWFLLVRGGAVVEVIESQLCSRVFVFVCLSRLLFSVLGVVGVGVGGFGLVSVLVLLVLLVLLLQ